MIQLEVPAPLLVFDLEMEDGAIVRIRRHGNPDGPRLILCHGNGFAIDAYAPFWGLLADRYELVLYDQRNHGKNPRHRVEHHDLPYFVRDMDRIFLGVRDRLGQKATAGVFHSISGITAIVHALEIAWRWDALVLFDPPMIASPDHPLYEDTHGFEIGLVEWSAGRNERFSDPADLAAAFAKSYSLRRWVPGAHDLMARSILRLDEASGDWILACPRAGESQVYATNAALDLCPRLGDLKGPVKFICSDPSAQDAIGPGLINHAMHEAYGHPYLAVPDTGHLLQIERPEACVAAVTDFLSDCGIEA